MGVRWGWRWGLRDEGEGWLGWVGVCVHFCGVLCSRPALELTKFTRCDDDAAEFIKRICKGRRLATDFELMSSKWGRNLGQNNNSLYLSF